MTLDELERLLAEAGVHPDVYCLTGGLPNEAYTLDHAPGRWAVYYSERGHRTGLHEHANESSACADLMRRVLDAVRLAAHPPAGEGGNP